MNYLTPEEMQQIKEFEELKKVVIRKILSKEAIERLGRIRLVKPELATQLEVYLLQAYQAGQINAIIDDIKLKQMLDAIVKKRNYKIKR